MALHVFGQREDGFSIALDVITYSPLYSSLTLRLGHNELGDSDEPMYLATALASLNVLRRRPLDCHSVVFDRWDQFPGYEALLERGSWSWTASFDRIEYIYFVIRDPRLVCFQWKSSCTDHDAKCQCPSTLISYEIPFAIYDRVIDELNKSVKKWTVI